jgi:hypothetical protein
VTRRILLALVSILALAVAGCGGKSADEKYADQFKPEAQAWKTAAEQFKTEVGQNSANLQGLAASVDHFRQATSTFADRLSSIKVPDKASSQQQDVVLALRTVTQDLQSFSAAITAADKALITSTGAKVQTSLQSVTTTVNVLASKFEKSK